MIILLQEYNSNNVKKDICLSELSNVYNGSICYYLNEYSRFLSCRERHVVHEMWNVPKNIV